MPNTSSALERYRFLNEAGCHLASANGLRASELASRLQPCFRGVSRREIMERIWVAVDEGDLVWSADRKIRLR